MSDTTTPTHQAWTAPPVHSAFQPIISVFFYLDRYVYTLSPSYVTTGNDGGILAYIAVTFVVGMVAVGVGVAVACGVLKYKNRKGKYSGKTSVNCRKMPTKASKHNRNGHGFTSISISPHNNLPAIWIIKPGSQSDARLCVP